MGKHEVEPRDPGGEWGRDSFWGEEEWKVQREGGVRLLGPSVKAACSHTLLGMSDGNEPPSRASPWAEKARSGLGRMGGHWGKGSLKGRGVGSGYRLRVVSGPTGGIAADVGLCRLPWEAIPCSSSTQLTHRKTSRVLVEYHEPIPYQSGSAIVVMMEKRLRH